MSDYISHDVHITFESMPGSYHVSWEVKCDGATAYGFENDFLNAAEQAEKALKDMGVDV